MDILHGPPRHAKNDRVTAWWRGLSLRAKVTGVTVAVLAIGLFAAGVGTMVFLRNAQIAERDQSVSQRSPRRRGEAARGGGRRRDRRVHRQRRDGHVVLRRGVRRRRRPPGEAGGPAPGPEFPERSAWTRRSSRARHRSHCPPRRGRRRSTRRRLPGRSRRPRQLHAAGRAAAVRRQPDGRQLHRHLHAHRPSDVGRRRAGDPVARDARVPQPRSGRRRPRCRSRRETSVSGWATSSPGTEVGRLKTAINAMLDRIDQALAQRDATVQQMRRFIGDASHELRTPLVTVRGYAELYRMGAISATSRPRSRWSASRRRPSGWASSSRTCSHSPASTSAATSSWPRSTSAPSRGMPRSTRARRRPTGSSATSTHDRPVTPAPCARRRRRARPDGDAATPRRRAPSAEVAGATLSLLRRRPGGSGRATLRRRTSRRGPAHAGHGRRTDRAGRRESHPPGRREPPRQRASIHTPDGIPDRAARRRRRAQPARAGSRSSTTATASPTQIREKIFQRFWRADTSRTRETGGIRARTVDRRVDRRGAARIDRRHRDARRRRDVPRRVPAGAGAGCRRAPSAHRDAAAPADPRHGRLNGRVLSRASPLRQRRHPSTDSWVPSPGRSTVRLTVGSTSTGRGPHGDLQRRQRCGDHRDRGVRATGERLQSETASMLASLTQLQGSWTGTASSPSRA